MKQCKDCDSTTFSVSIVSDRWQCRICGQWYTQAQYDALPDAVTPEQYAALVAERDALRAENAALREAQRWIPVEERLPEVGDVVLLVVGKTVKEGQLNTQNRWRVWGGQYEFSSVSKWKPLPPPTD